MNKPPLIRVRERVKARWANAVLPAVSAGSLKNALAYVGFASMVTFTAMQANSDLAAGLIQTVFPEAVVAELDNDTDSEAVASAMGDVSFSRLHDRSDQRMVDYLSSRFRVSREAMADMVRYANQAAEKHRLDPALVLAVAAVESGFNPYAASPMGAKGLMQVMSRIHSDKFEVYSDIRNPVTHPQANLMVGAEILRDCIKRGGSVNAGLKLYLGVGSGDDNGYVARVVTEATRIRAAAKGRAVTEPSAQRRDSVKVAAVSKGKPAAAQRRSESDQAARLLNGDES